MHTIQPYKTALMCCAFVMCFTIDAICHIPFQSYIEHHFDFDVQDHTVDCALTLTFQDQAALSERQALDTNRDSIISPKEIQLRLQSIENKLSHEILVSCNKEPLSVISLYPPDAAIYQKSLSYSLFFFIRLPNTVDTVNSMVLNDRFFPETPAVLLWNSNRINLASTSPAPIFSKTSQSQPRNISIISKPIITKIANQSETTKKLNLSNILISSSMILISIGIAVVILLKLKGRISA